jgi:hypothetical protein
VLVELGLSVVGCAALCYALGRYNHSLVLRRWEFVLTLPAKRAVAAVEQKMQLDSALARQALEASSRARAAGRHEQAAGVLKAALGVLEDAGADRRTRLRAMGVYSRMLQAIRPLPSPSQAPYRGARMRLVASGASVVHRFLVGSGERFRLWLLMLGYGVRVVLGGARRSVAEAGLDPAAERPFVRFADGLHDFEALDRSHLAAFEALSASLAAIDRETRERVWDRLANP